ncbi:bifunctional riboflavin kinase/FAD synthetase [Neiella marina]|uniref:Riboflavin biosynthesis protein n=1 Tax=Neiella holothuriorum TaxID=2870530 RepID=A0ABS7EJC9_9GAMM|nr:bifunctional riboflavin kinase/FAD synthetase [Neiella holothuriorum]MBW8191876.1 bifunctional riboflavin kinase/FAD synthetase [Neiella holothuriorum]
MELIRGIHNLRDRHRQCVLTIGNFDGVHLGHQAVLRQLVAKAKVYGVPSMVMVFEPQPQEVFAGDKAPARLSLLRDKVRLLSQMGIDRLLCVQFNHRFAAISASRFISHLLVEKLAIRYLVVGDDFCFGKGRQGQYQDLVTAGNDHGFDVNNTHSFMLQQVRVSSTKIRAALADNHLDIAESLLGHRYALTGRVVHGDALGRTIGFPTANVLMKRQVIPVQGVYAVETELADGTQVLGMANIGRRPTVKGTRPQLEVHLFDFDGDLYGQRIKVELVAKLREEQRFASVDALKQQLELDKITARQQLVSDTASAQQTI